MADNKKDYQSMLLDTFSLAPPVSTPAPAGAPFTPQIPEPRKYETRNSVTRDMSPESVAHTQSVIWGTGPTPPPKAPNQKMLEQGTAPQMKQTEGWGKI